MWMNVDKSKAIISHIHIFVYFDSSLSVVTNSDWVWLTSTNFDYYSISLTNVDDVGLILINVDHSWLGLVNYN